ncbi:CsbD family protein [Pseudonocardiaceae bacterium YIM PH 21723]|nr:CsbD family protein [Pseudonocardiaceae bacterium YIM PH 21723]
MGFADDAKNKAQDLLGKGKEAAGQATDNKDLQAEGKADQAEAGLKDVLQKGKDAVESAVDKLKDLTNKK